MGSLLTLLIAVIIIAAIVAVLIWAVSYLELQPPLLYVARVIIVVFVLVACLWLLSQVVGTGGLHLGFG